jgi:hypothetical protein
MKAAEAAAKQPGAAPAQGAALNASASATNAMNLQAIQVRGEGTSPSPLPAIPSGVNQVGAAAITDPLTADLVQVQKYLNVLYPFTTPDPQDAYWQRRSEVVDGHGFVPGTGKAIVPPEYFDYVQRKSNQLMADEFKKFIFQQIDLTTPAAREWWETRFPEYTREFREGWNKRIGHMARMGNMIINGVQSTDDLFYLFITSKGLNPVAYQYSGPPKANQVAAMFKAYQQMINPVAANANPTRLGQTLPGDFPFGSSETRPSMLTGQTVGYGRGPQTRGVSGPQQPGPIY